MNSETAWLEAGRKQDIHDCIDYRPQPNPPQPSTAILEAFLPRLSFLSLPPHGCGTNETWYKLALPIASWIRQTPDNFTIPLRPIAT
jgi:hypothetical protein